MPHHNAVRFSLCCFNVEFKVHYPRFDSQLLVSAGNDKRLLVWDQRQFEQRAEPSSRIKGGDGPGGSSGGGGGGEKLKQSGKKKGRAKGLNKKISASPTAGQPSSNDAAPNTGSEETGQGSSGGVTEPEPQAEDGVVRCSRPLLSTHLEEKPNWITSLVTPYPAIAIADTSSVAKILRRRGGT